MLRQLILKTGYKMTRLTPPPEVRKTIYLVLFLLLVAALAFFVRLDFMQYESVDYQEKLSVWYHFLKANHGFSALKNLTADYPAIYMYFMAAATYIPIPALAAVKLFSILFDYFAALVVFRLVQLKYADNLIPALALTAVLFWPTVILNSSMWGQCDMIYTGWLLASVLCLLRKRRLPAMVFFGLALSFKLQTVFLSPLLFLYWLKKELSVWQLAVVPLVFVASVLPGVLLGKPFMQAISIYWLQAGQYPALTKNALSIYQLVPPQLYAFFIKPAVMFAGVFMLCLCLIINRYLKALTPDNVLEAALAFALCMPFLLPKMHERYFFPADIISVVYAFYFPRKLHIPLIIVALSYFSYCPFLFGTVVLELKYLSLVMAAVIVMLLREMVLKPGRQSLGKAA